MRQHVELLYPRCRLADAPAEQHVEFQPASPTDLTEPCHIEGLGKRHHRHGRLHPQLEGDGTIGIFGINFLLHLKIGLTLQSYK